MRFVRNTSAAESTWGNYQYSAITTANRFCPMIIGEKEVVANAKSVIDGAGPWQSGQSHDRGGSLDFVIL